jgi:hypothetical protein
VYERISNENILCTRDRYDAGFLSDARSWPGSEASCQFLTGRRMVRLVCCALRYEILCVVAVLNSPIEV